MFCEVTTSKSLYERENKNEKIIVRRDKKTENSTQFSEKNNNLP